MNRFVIYSFVIFSTYFLFHVSPAFSNPTALAVIAEAEIGPMILAVSGGLAGVGITKAALSTTGNYYYQGGNIYAPLIKYNDIMVDGVYKALGATYPALVNIEDAYNRGILQADVKIKGIIDSLFPPSSYACPLDGIVTSSDLMNAYPGALYDIPIGNWKLVYSYQGPNGDFDRVRFPPGDYWKLSTPGTTVRETRERYIYVSDSSYPQNYIGNKFTQIYEKTTEDPTYIPPSGPPAVLSPDQSAAVAQAIANQATTDQDTKAAMNQIIQSHPDLVSPPSPITREDIEGYKQSAIGAAQQSLIDDLTAKLAANPADTTLQAELAKAQADQAIQNANDIADQPSPPEPSFPVPSAWYTKTCDISQGLGSCIDYQQVLSASDAFKNTAIYQFPNLLLQCIGYFEGDGCEYPPAITVDFHNAFSSEPIKINLTPFESVVRVMKFFFSILCLVGTGKATMTLFE